MNNFDFFSLNLGKLPNYVRYFGSYKNEGVSENWAEAEWASWRWMELGGGWNELGGGGWSWVEVGARFSNTRFLFIFWASNKFFVSWAWVKAADVAFATYNPNKSVTWKQNKYFYDCWTWRI